MQIEGEAPPLTEANVITKDGTAGVQVGDLMQFVRPLLLLMSFVGLAMWLARKGSNNDAADAD